MKIWVAGHKGMVGKSLTAILKKQYKTVHTKSRKELDLTDLSAVRNFLSSTKFDWIFITAGKVGGIEANINFPLDFLYENLMINNNILRASYEMKIKKVLVLGSSCMYPKNASQPIKENSILTGSVEPTNEGYAISKIVSTRLAKFYCEQFNSNFISVIPSATFGPNDNFSDSLNHVIPALIKKFHNAKVNKKNSVEVWGSGKALREFLFVEDLAEGLIFLMKNYSDPSPINLGSGEEITIQELSYEISKTIGYSGKIVFNISKPEGVKRKLLDSSKIKKMGWRPKFNLSQGLQITYEKFKKNNL